MAMLYVIRVLSVERARNRDSFYNSIWQESVDIRENGQYQAMSPSSVDMSGFRLSIGKYATRSCIKNCPSARE